MASKEAEPQNDTESKEVNTNENASEDVELNELLDNALKDFDATPKKGKENNVTDTNKGDEKWENEFAKFQENFMKTLVDGESSNENEDIANKFFSDFDPSSADNSELLSTFAKSMSELTKDLKDVMDPTCEEEFKKLQEAINLDELHSTESASEDPASLLSNLMGNMSTENTDSSSIFGIMPLMQNVLKNLLSKDLLYTPLKDIVDKFPDWLAENKMQLDDKDFDRYESQFVLMKKVCEEFDSETAEDSEEVKSDRFERIINHMQKMQLCGQPPKELVENVDFPLNEFGMPNLGDVTPDKCSIM